MFVSIFPKFTSLIRVFHGVSEVKNLRAIQGTLVWSLGWKVYLEKEMATQYSYLENPMGRGAWQAMVLRIAKSWTRLKQCSMHAKTNNVNKVSEQIFIAFSPSLCWVSPAMFHWAIGIEVLERRMLSTWVWQVGTGRKCETWSVGDWLYWSEIV